MAAPATRDDENNTRKKRLAKVKRGPGVFAYRGGAFDTEWIPTPLLTGKSTPVFSAAGLPVLDAAGRQVYERVGQPVRDVNGNIVLGGEPKVVKHPLDVLKVRGVEFPKDKEVEVNDEALARKLRCLPFVEELEAVRIETEVDEVAEVEPKKRGPGRPKKTESVEV